MSHKHDQLLRALFHDPVSGNIHWREVESLLRHLGARVEPAHGARFKVVLNGAETLLHHPHHSSVLGRERIKAVRDLLNRAGIRGTAGDREAS